MGSVRTEMKGLEEQVGKSHTRSASHSTLTHERRQQRTIHDNRNTTPRTYNTRESKSRSSTDDQRSARATATGFIDISNGHERHGRSGQMRTRSAPQTRPAVDSFSDSEQARQWISQSHEKFDRRGRFRDMDVEERPCRNSWVTQSMPSAKLSRYQCTRSSSTEKRD